MPENKDQQNVSELVELVKSYGEDLPEDYEDSGIDAMTDDEVREKISQQFMGDGLSDILKDVKISDTYTIDENFLAEAENEAEEEIVVEQQEEILADEIFEETEESAMEEERGEILYSLEDLIDDNDILLDDIPDNTDSAAEEFDDDITFDELEEQIANNAELISAMALENDEDITFDELEDIIEESQENLNPIVIEDSEPYAEMLEEIEDAQAIEEADAGIAYMHLEEEPFSSDDISAIELEKTDSDDDGDIEVTFENFILKESRRIADEESFELLKNEEIESDELFAIEKDEDVVDGNFFDEIFSEDEITVSNLEESALEALAKSEADGSEISLLLQLGCEDEVIEHYEVESLDKITEEEALKNISDDEYGFFDENDEQEQTRGAIEKIRARHEFYKTRRGGLLFRLALSSLVAILLFAYEAIPALFGVELPGIMNREDYFFSYVLLGFQLVVFCALPVYKSIFDGAKKLLSRSANAYSMVAALAVPTFIYDLIIMFADTEHIPVTFHFALACTIVLALVQECQAVTSEKRSFEFYFSNMLESGETEEIQKCFTLCKSEGKSSVAEKMYSGNNEAVRNLYFPIEIDGNIGFLSAVNARSSKRDLPMILLIPSLVVSLLVGVFAFIASGSFITGWGGILLSLFFSLPIVATLASWLPFERLSAKFAKDGFAFASEGSMENYSDCNMVLFSDLLLFSKCSPANVNLALYDATSKEVLLGCLSALYSEIGGPMCSAFSGAKNDKLGKCRIKRVAKSGVEAVVGTNYSVLIGSELFMSRYGISFPNAVLTNSEDEVFTLCVSINGRASARIAVRYVLNDMFLMFLHRLAEDGIECVVETFDPMISTELIKRVMGKEKTPISIVHLNAQDHDAKRDKDRDRVLFEASGAGLGVLARYSKLNLHVSLSAAKRMTKLRKIVNAFAIAFSSFGALIALAAAGFGWIDGFSQFYLILYWLIGVAGIVALTLNLLPSRDRYSYEEYKFEKENKQER